MMYDGRVCAWKLTGEHLVGSFLFPFSVESPPLFSCSHTPFPNIFNTLRCSSFLFPSLFFFFFSSPPLLLLSLPLLTPRRLLGSALLAVHSLCFSRSSTTFLYPPLPPQKPTSPSPCAPVHWRSPGLESIVVHLITFHRVDFAAACSSKYHHYYYSLVRHCPAVPSFVRSIGPVKSTLPARGKHHHSTTASAL